MDVIFRGERYILNVERKMRNRLPRGAWGAWGAPSPRVKYFLYDVHDTQ